VTGTMWRVAKQEGLGNVILEQVPIPRPDAHEVLVRTRASLISRGSELWQRYEKVEAVDPSRMGYSTSGVVQETGTSVTEVAPGDRVAVTAPHAEYSCRAYQQQGRTLMRLLPETINLEAGTFYTLASCSVGWTRAASLTQHDRVVVLGQGVVGNLVMQFARRYRPSLLVAVDALELRCRVAAQCGAQAVVSAADEEPVTAIRRLTGGDGATAIFDCVGGRAGVRSFQQAQQMLAPGGTLFVVARYHGSPLQINAEKMAERQIYCFAPTPRGIDRDESDTVALGAIASGEVQVAPLITHRFPGVEAKHAFDLLYHHPEEALAVLLKWA
jgi:threonine dehydrogenase-like Zn-dependent dehydrogenase